MVSFLPFLYIEWSNSTFLQHRLLGLPTANSSSLADLLAGARLFENLFSDLQAPTIRGPSTGRPGPSPRHIRIFSDAWVLRLREFQFHVQIANMKTLTQARQPDSRNVSFGPAGPEPKIIREIPFPNGVLAC